MKSLVERLRARDADFDEHTREPDALCQEAADEIERLERLVYVPGHWQCRKCEFYLVSTNLHAESGRFSANDKPQECANGCGPMWRVTHEQSANTLVDRLDTASDEIQQAHDAICELWTVVMVTEEVDPETADYIHGVVAQHMAAVSDRHES